MIHNPYRFVVDAEGYCVAHALHDSYVLKQGEAFIETPPPGNIYIPRWNGEVWEEGATAEELEWTKFEPQT